MAGQLHPTQMIPRHMPWTPTNGMLRSQSTFGGPCTFMFSRPAQESNQRRTENQKSWALVGCSVRTSDIRLPPGQGSAVHCALIQGAGVPIKLRDLAALG